MLAEEGSSFEQNPPTLVEFIRRDLRWCQGNMQYWHFLRMPGLQPVSRYQLAFAILMFIGSPAWIGMLLIGSAAVALAPTPADFMRWDAGIAAPRPGAGDVVCAQYRDRDRRADPREAAAPVRRRAAVHRELHASPSSSSCCSLPSCGRATRCFWRGFCSAAPSAGARRRATITRCRGRSRCGTSGRRP